MAAVSHDSQHEQDYFEEEFPAIIDKFQSNFNWPVKSAVIQLCRSRVSTPEPLDIIKECFDFQNKYPNKSNLRPRDLEKIGGLLFFPIEHTGNSPAIRNKLLSLVTNCLEGTTLIIGRNRGPSKPNSVTERICLHCPRCRVSRAKPKNGPVQKTTSTRRADCSEDRCNFQVVLTHEYDPTKPKPQNETCGRWYIRLDGAHNFNHSKHIRYEFPPRPSRHHMSKKSLERIKSLFRMDYTPRTAAALLDLLDGNQNPGILRMLNKLKNDVINENDSNKTYGESLLDFLEESNDVRYVVYKAERDLALGLHTVKKKTKGKAYTAVEIQKSHQAELDALCDGLTQEDDDVLVAVAWVTEEQRKIFSEILGVDCMFGTNEEKRPVLRLVGRTTNNKNIPLLTCFLPNQSKEIFLWFFRDVVPELFGKENANKLRILTSDQDERCIDAFYMAKHDYGLYPLAEVRLCKWHKVNRGYTSKAHTYEKKVNKDFVEKVKNWMYSFTHCVESEQEEKESLTKLQNFLSDPSHISMGVCRNLIRFTKQFVTRNFAPCLPRFSHWRFLKVPNGDRAHNCAIESDNSSVKRDERAPLPSMHINRSAIRFTNRDRRYNRKLLQEIYNDMIVTVKQKKEETLEEHVLRVLSSDIVISKARDVVHEWTLSMSGIYKITPGDDKGKIFQTFHVQATNEVPPVASFPWCRDSHRIRIVTVHRSLRGGCIFKCSCGTFPRCKYPCRHILCVLARPPVNYDIHPQCYKAYVQMALDCEGFMPWYSNLERYINEMEGIPIPQNFPYDPPTHLKEAHVEMAAYFPSAHLVSTRDPEQTKVELSSLYPPNPSPMAYRPTTASQSTIASRDLSLRATLTKGKSLERQMFQRCQSTLETTLRYCTTIEMCEFVENGMHELMTATMRKSQATNSEAGRKGLRGFGATDRRKKDYRKSATNTPEKKKKDRIKSHKRPSRSTSPDRLANKKARLSGVPVPSNLFLSSDSSDDDIPKQQQTTTPPSLLKQKLPGAPSKTQAAYNRMFQHASETDNDDSDSDGGILPPPPGYNNYYRSK